MNPVKVGVCHCFQTFYKKILIEKNRVVRLINTENNCELQSYNRSSVVGDCDVKPCRYLEDSEIFFYSRQTSVEMGPLLTANIQFLP